MRSVWLIFALFASFVGVAQAGGQVAHPVVVQVRVDSSGNGIVFFDQLIGGAPATCATPAYNNAFAFNANTAGGKAILALALLAKASGTPLFQVYGSGSCSVYSGTVEDWSWGE